MALPTHLDLQIVTPDRLVVRERVDEVQIPGAEGYFGVLPGHTPLLASLAVGEMWYRKGRRRPTSRWPAASPKCCPTASRSWRGSPSAPTRSTSSAPRRAQARARSGWRADGSEIDYERARIALAKSLSRLQVSSRLDLGARTGELKRVRTQG